MKLVKKINLDIYKQYENELNEFNKFTLNNLETLKDNLNKDIFKVPSYRRNTVWGYEDVFMPFTDKLFKIVETKKEETSVQLHPRKNETWYPLKKSTIFDGKKLINVEEKNSIFIKKNTIHAMKKNGKIFEVQDNSVFDDYETIRLFDKSGRKVDSKKDYLTYLLPYNKNNIKINDIKIEKINNDFFIFILKGSGYIKDIKLEENNLYYAKYKLLDELKIKGDYLLINARYYKEDN